MLAGTISTFSSRQQNERWVPLKSQWWGCSNVLLAVCGNLNGENPNITTSTTLFIVNVQLRVLFPPKVALSVGLFGVQLCLQKIQKMVWFWIKADGRHQWQTSMADIKTLPNAQGLIGLSVRLCQRVCFTDGSSGGGLQRRRVNGGGQDCVDWSHERPWERGLAIRSACFLTFFLLCFPPVLRFMTPFIHSHSFLSALFLLWCRCLTASVVFLS